MWWLTCGGRPLGISPADHQPDGGLLAFPGFVGMRPALAVLGTLALDAMAGTAFLFCRLYRNKATDAH